MTATLRKAFRDSNRTLLWLLIGWSLYVLLIMSFFPMLVEQSADFDEMIKNMPRQITGMFVSGDLDDFSVADPGTFLQMRYAAFLILIVGTMAMAQAFNAITNAERDGTLDVMLSLPITRRDYLLGRMANTGVLIFAALVLSYLMLAGSTFIMREFDVALDSLALAVFMGFFPLATAASFAYMLAVVVPSSKGFAGPIAYLMLIGSYLVHGFAASIADLEPIRPLLLFDYYNVTDLINDGLSLRNVLIPSAAITVYTAVAWWFIDKKELGV
ncbi:MAG: ABC transporter permease [Anaerolineae bacterium]|nr:ABC transporter permease [Anaerolineae bacterium]